MAFADSHRLLFNESPVAILLVSREGEIVEANVASTRTFSREREKLVGTPVLSWVVSEDRDRSRQFFQRVLEGATREWTSRIRRGDGVPRVLSFRGAPLEDGEGRTKALVLFARDFTENREGRPETVQLQTLLENVPGQFTAVLDPQGRIRYSSGLSRTHLRDDSELVGEEFRELLDDEAPAREGLAALLEAAAEGRDWAGSMWHIRRDGSRFPARTFCSPYRDPRSGRLLGALVVGQDVTREFELRDREKQAGRLASIGGLVASIARELDDTTVRVLSAVGDGNGTAPDGRRIRNEVQRMRAFLNALDEFSQHTPLARGSTDLNTVVRHALGSAQDRLRSQGIQVGWPVNEDPIQVFGDPGQAARVLEILIQNAEEATRGSADPRVEVELRESREGGIVRVANTGAVIPKEWLDKVFDPFFTTKEGHAGLGLALARGIAQVHGGRLWCDRTPDGLTAFYVEFPRTAPESVLPFRPVPLTLTRSRSILLVDDEAAVREGMRKFLEKVGYEVREAWSGRSALAQITAGRPPELVVTDLKMTDGSGYWFLSQLSRDFPHLLKHTVVVTGDGDHDEASRLAEKTGCPVVRKPFDLRYLLEVLDEVALTS